MEYTKLAVKFPPYFPGIVSEVGCFQTTKGIAGPSHLKLYLSID